jgi:negative regulator of flagellin synthesis FlgM
MNVENNSIQGLQQLFSAEPVPRAETVRGAGAAAAGAAGTEANTDQAKLSAAASAAALLAPDADVRPDKVTQIQQALVSGTYQVPSSAVADKILGAMLSR